jgi:hypothetical protein
MKYCGWWRIKKLIVQRSDIYKYKQLTGKNGCTASGKRKLKPVDFLKKNDLLLTFFSGIFILRLSVEEAICLGK